MTLRPVWPPPQVGIHGSVGATMAPDPDLALLEAWRNGDRAAADTLLTKYYNLIRRTVATKLPPDAVDDTVQHIVTELVERRDAFRSDATLRTYVLAIARNTIVDFYRKRKRAVEPIAVVDISVLDLGAGPSTLLLRHENQRLLLEALRSIPLDDQLILELYYWEEMSGPELAQVFEAPEPTIRGRLRRAKERLEAQLHQLAHDPRELAETITDLNAWAKKLRDELKPYLEQVRQGHKKKK
jgi:RNA polymerase sigma factor (sigma-70 family)